MIRRVACLTVLSLLVFLSSFSSDNQASAQNGGASGAQAVHASQSQKRAINRAAVAKSTARRFAQSAPPTSIGFLGAPRTFALGGIPGIFPAVMGDFAGKGFQSAATIVNTGAATNKFSISVALNNGAGSFTSVLTTLTGEDQQDPIFVGDLNGDGKADLLVVHAAYNPGTTTIEAWLSNGDGTFTASSQGTVPVTTNAFVWATIADVNGDGCPDVVLADADFARKHLDHPW